MHVNNLTMEHSVIKFIVHVLAIHNFCDKWLKQLVLEHSVDAWSLVRIYLQQGSDQTLHVLRIMARNWIVLTLDNF